MEKLIGLLNKNGHKATLDNEVILFQVNDEIIKVSIGDGWKDVIEKASSNTDVKFNFDDRVFQDTNYVEMQIVCLDDHFAPRVDRVFKDNDDTEIAIELASDEFRLELLKCNQTQEFLIERLERLSRRRARRDDDGKISIDFDYLLPRCSTISYYNKNSTGNILSIAKSKAKACLFKIAHYNEGCWELVASLKNMNQAFELDIKDEMDDKIPFAIYKDELIAHYKVALSSRYASQAFLSYYHILEYFFLRVSEEELLIKARAIINSAAFSSGHENIIKLVNVIKSTDAQQDETEMLRLVMRKYVDEGSLIDFIKSIESQLNDTVYTKSKSNIFGERINIRLESGHTLSNTAKIIKHIRNALVHSTDRYSREDCYLPFSESDLAVKSYLPLIRFVAEQVIFATAK